MSYVSLSYYILVIITFALYYIFPLKYRWLVLLFGSGLFYCYAMNRKLQLLIFGFSVVSTYCFGRILSKKETMSLGKKRSVLFVGIILASFPLLASKLGDFLTGSILHTGKINWVLTVGLSFYSLQLISYLVDVYKGKTKAQTNVFKFFLFASFFPQIIQGPIPRYNQLEKQLYEGNLFDAKSIVKGMHLILWGFFLKYMIADKAGMVVDTVFDNYTIYAGVYVWVAAILYSIQLYADFLSCVTMSQGVAKLFGIELVNNFEHPYFSKSIKEFWRRWHMSFSFWLRDYVYIPLGGNRGGTISKYFNLITTFAVSGIWHGGSWKFLFWGVLQAFYQIFGEKTLVFREKIYRTVKIEKNSFSEKFYKTVGTFFWIMLGWIIFRASSLKAALYMIWSMFTTYNPWVITTGEIMQFGLDWRDWMLLIGSICSLALVSFVQEKIIIRDWILEQHITLRWGIYILGIVIIWLYGTYGFGFDARAFIYGGF